MVRRNITKVKGRPLFLEKRSYNLKEAAEYIGRSVPFVRRLAEKGFIPCKRVQNGKSERFTYIFSQSELDAWDTTNAIDLNSFKINPVDIANVLKENGFAPAEIFKIIACLMGTMQKS